MPDRIVIIGTGLAGYSVAQKFRKHDQTTHLTLITRDGGEYYNKPVLSNALTKEKTPEVIPFADAAHMAEKLDAEILTHRQVESINREEKVIQLKDGEHITYSQLVLGCGGHVHTPPIDIDNDCHVYQINNLEDYKVFRQALQDKRKIAVVGAGLIGCELANDLINTGYEVTSIALENAPLEFLIPYRAGKALRTGLERRGVRWLLDCLVQEIRKKRGGCQLVLNDGQSLDVDLVLCAIGLMPNLTLAKQAGLKIHRGIEVDPYLKTSDPAIYALGDCAEVMGHVLQFIKPIAHASNAIAQSLAGEPTRVMYPPMPVVVKTPACPVVAIPPPQDVFGEWRFEQEDTNVKGVFYDDNQQLRGFVLTGTYIKELNGLAKQVPPVLE